LESNALLPQLDAVGNDPEPVWVRIEREYRTTNRSIRDIAREFGVSQPAISKRVKRDGWTRQVITEVITAPDNQRDNQADNQGDGRFLACAPSLDDFVDDEFWEYAEGTIVAENQEPVSVYIDDTGAIAFRQRLAHESEDRIVRIRPEFAPRLLKRLQSLMHGRAASA
jgi:hypothetical protein